MFIEKIFPERGYLLLEFSLEDFVTQWQSSFFTWRKKINLFLFCFNYESIQVYVFNLPGQKLNVPTPYKT